MTTCFIRFFVGCIVYSRIIIFHFLPMQNLRLCAFCALILVTACKSSDNSLPTGNKKITTVDPVKAKKSTIDQQPAKTIIDFLKWYREYDKRSNKPEMINNCPPTNDTTKFYSVNFEATEAYLAEFKKSGFVSDKYVQVMRGYFKKCDDYLKKHPENDGPPDGFEFDLVMWSQEYDEDLANIDKSTIIDQTVAANKAAVKLGFPTGGSLLYKLSKQGDKWLIDRIQNNWTNKDFSLPE